jgi:hypothetical protein
MRIEGSGSREVGRARRPPVGGEATTPLPPIDPSMSSSHAASPELKALQDRVESLPEVRQDVIAEVANRLRSGALSSPEAVARTAAALLADAAQPG